VTASPVPMRTWRQDGLCARSWAGGDPAVVCFPSAGGSALAFRPLAAALVPEFTVIAVDPPAHGGSSGPPLPDVRATAALAVRMLEPAVSGPVVLLGSSLGGYVAYEAARLLLRQPARSAWLRLVICAAAAPGTPGALPGPEHDDDSLIDALVGMGGVPAAVRAEPELLRQYLPVLRSDLVAYAAYVRSWRPPARPLPCPTLVLGGDADPVVSVDRLVGWRLVCAPARFRLLRGGHHIPQQQPADLAAEIRRWLAAPGARTDVAAGLGRAS
jgi:medium-chain acyl-[acyl-carrier-protein] hydrolase